jgi:hypothetical protein
MNPTLTDGDVVQLRRYVEQLVDHDEIATLIHRLGACLDEGRFDDMRSLFVEDATARTPGGLAEGIDAMIVQASRTHSPDEGIQHLISDELIDVDGDRASVRANLIVTFAPRTAAPARSSQGEIYHFDAQRTSHGWRLARVEAIPVWTAGSPIGSRRPE